MVAPRVTLKTYAMLKEPVKYDLSHACNLACYLTNMRQRPLTDFARRRVTVDWISKVRAKMDALGLDQADLWRARRSTMRR